MKTATLLAYTALASLPLHAIPASTTLTLVNETGFNRLSVTVNPQVSGLSLPSFSTTILSGDVIADLQIDPAAGTSSELTLREGRVSGTKLTFKRDLQIFLTTINIYNIVIDNISAAIDTPTPPGLVDPATGSFDAAQYTFTLDQGTVTGTATIPGQDPITVNEAFTPEEPVTGNGSGNGTLTLLATPSAQPELYRDFLATIIFPINLDDTFETGGNTIAVTASGTIKATGTVQVPKSEYLAWTIEEGITGADGQADANNDGVPNAIAWALGFGASENAQSALLRPANGSYEIQLPASGSVAPIFIEGSDLASSFLPISAARVSTSMNPLPPGSTGLITITRLADEFLRLKVDE